MEKVNLEGLKKNYVLDTSVLIHNPKSLYSFEENNVIIPFVVIEELDNIKQKKDAKSFQAREVIRELKALSKRFETNEIELQSGGKIIIHINKNEDYINIPFELDQSKNDNIILATALKYKQEDKHIVLVTKDTSLYLKGLYLGLEVQDYEKDKIDINTELYKGYREIYLDQETINEVYRSKNGIDIPYELEKTLYPNEFIVGISPFGKSIIFRYNSKMNKLIKINYDKQNQTTNYWGLKPRNEEQRMAYELLTNDDINFVSMVGGAGTGKTILATATGLQKVVEEGKYKKIVFVKPITPAGDDIGYLPGTEEEKLKPWMGSFYDAIESLIDIQTSRDKEIMSTKKDAKIEAKKQQKQIDKGETPLSKVDKYIEELRLKGMIETKTFNYMRGRTLSDAYVIVDEAQQITPHLAKLMITRAGENCKFVFIGDPCDNQIDNIFLDSKSNGLVYIVEKFKEFDITGHIKLREVERSNLAELAEKYL